MQATLIHKLWLAEEEEDDVMNVTLVYKQQAVRKMHLYLHDDRCNNTTYSRS